MLIISLDRVAELLDKAAEVQLPEPADVDDVTEAAAEASDRALTDDPAYRELEESIAALTPDEAYDLLALALLERNSADLGEWQTMLEQARAFPAEELPAQLAETLVLTDDIELALERLGLVVDEDEADEVEDEDAEPEE